MLIALVPAHNEQDVIEDALRGLITQTVRPDAIITVADNCTDKTEFIARHYGHVWPTTNNTDKKAGALNQTLDRLLGLMSNDDYILVTDADSVLDPEFIAHALQSLDDRSYGAIGGTFRGQPGGGFVGHLQRNEYARYARDVRRLRGKCLVVTGTAALFRVGVLKEIRASRLAGKLPAGDGRGGVYDTTVLTEDNELSFAMMTLGYKILSPEGATLTTEVMPTWGDLWKQRKRWKLGALQNCAQYGLTRVTWRYWGRQAFSAFGMLVSAMYLFSLVWFGLQGDLSLHPIWLAVSGVFVVERVVTVRERGWNQMLFAATMIELLYDYFLQACHASALWSALLGRKGKW